MNQNIINGTKKGELAGKKFTLAAIVASSVLIIGEQAVIVFCSTQYFNSIGEWIWNLFVSISFLWSFVTLYGLVGGVCWQTIVSHVDPFGLIASKISASSKDPGEDSKAAAEFAGIVIAICIYALSIFLIQLHFSSAYRNKPLAAFLFTMILFLALPFAVAVYALTRNAAICVTSRISRLAPGRVLKTEIALFVIGAGVLSLLLILANSYLLDIIDVRPWIILLLFLTAHGLIYRFFNHPAGREAFESVFNSISVGAWLLAVGAMLGITVLAYPSQPRVASILRNQSPFARPLILALQRIIDNDGDGFSPILRGGDCNDANPLIHPMAQEIPANGLDDDCIGGDAFVVREERRERDELLALRIESIRRPYNVIMISVDAVRADHLGCYGYHRDTSPEIDSFAKGSHFFSGAYAQAPNTPQSVPSILTGMYPSQIHWSRYANFPKVLNGTETVMDVLKSRGYHVAGIFSYWYFENRNLERESDWWDTRAFRTRGHSERYSTDDLVTNNAIEHLKTIEGGVEPLFMWLHYFDPHFLYAKHDGIDFGPRQIDLYDGEIRNSSREVGRFLDFFRRTKWYENSVIFILADHGEEFGEHGRKYHGSQIYQESVHVPLIIHMPDMKPRTVSSPVGLVDIAPTIYDLVGADDRLAKVQGRSLLPLILGGGDYEAGPVYIEKITTPTFPWSMQSLIDGRWKIIYRAHEQLFELYDLKGDPGEKRDLYEDLPEKAAKMKLKLTDFRQRRLNRDTGWYSMARASREKSDSMQ